MLLLPLQAAASMIGEQWRIDFFGRAAGNVRFTAIHPGGMLSDIARKSVPGMNGFFPPIGLLHVWLCHWHSSSLLIFISSTKQV